MSELLLPFARRKSDGRLVSPDEVERGLACGCECPDCSTVVLARQGTEKIWHFAHHRTIRCVDGYGRSVHEMAKQILRERKTLLLPSLVVVASINDPRIGTLTDREHVFDERRVELDECASGVAVGDVTPDVLGRLRDRQIAVEITVGQRLSPDKTERLLATGLACMEIDLSVFKTVQATRELVEAALFGHTGRRQWIFHPRAAGIEAQVRARLEARKIEMHDSIDRHRQEATAHRARTLPLSPPSFYSSHVRAVGLPYQHRAQEPEESVAPSVADDMPRWRIAFPDDRDIRRAQTALSERTGVRLMRIFAVTTRITTADKLRSYTPTDLAERWASELGVAPEEVMRFFSEAYYIA